MPKTFEISNNALAVKLSTNGSLQHLDNALSGESYHIRADTFAVVTNQGTFSNRNVAPVKHELRDGQITYTFSSGQYDVVLAYTMAPDHNYLERNLTLTNIKKPLTLLKIELGRTAFTTVPRESIKYNTFWNAPTVNFLRWPKGGLFSGIENPFFRVATTADEITFSFEPALILEPGAIRSSETPDDPSLSADHPPQPPPYGNCRARR